MLMRPVALVAALIGIFWLAGCSQGDPNVVRTYGLGEQAQVGSLIYTVFETQWLMQLGKGPSARVPQNRFFLVRISAANSGGSQALVPALSIEDDNGNTYPELSNGEGVPQWAEYLREVKPAEAAQGNVLFDAPPRHYKMRVKDETGERSALVDIPLSFGAETPDLPAPGADAHPLGRKGHP